MAGLSYSTLNLLRGGYQGSDPDLEAIYGLGLSTGRNALSDKQLQDRLKFERQQLTSGLIEQGMGTPREASYALSDITGYPLSVPNLSRKTDVNRVSNLMNLMHGYRYAQDQASYRGYWDPLNQGGWGNIARGLKGQMNQGFSPYGGSSISNSNIGALARKSLSIGA